MRMKIIGKSKLLISILLSVLIYCRTVFFILRHGTKLINSDCAAEIILADLLNKEHALMSTNWFYSTELKILDTNLFFKLGLWLSPDNWNVARTIAVAAALIIIFAVSFSLMHALKASKWCSCLFAAFTICPVGPWYGWNVLYNLYYVMHVATTMVTLALFVRFINRKNPVEKKWEIVLLTLISLLAGMVGIRRLMICIVPLWLASIVEYRDRFHRSEPRMILKMSYPLFWAMIGFVVYKVGLSKIYSVASTDTQTWYGFSLERIIRCISDLFGLYGWRSGVPIVSIQGLYNLISVFAIVLSLIIGLRVLFNYRGGGGAMMAADVW